MRKRQGKSFKKMLKVNNDLLTLVSNYKLLFVDGY